MHINDLLKTMVGSNGSDLHLKVGSPAIMRVDGNLIPMSKERLSADAVNQMVFSILNEKQKKDFTTTRELDFAYGVPGVARFRVNLCQQRGTVRVVMRIVPFNVKNFKELCLPEKPLTFLCGLNHGLVLITGPTGSGKSTTLASMIDYVNNTRNAHVVTVEDPIEFLYRDNRCIISQREIGTDTDSFSAALRHVLRQDPDVILIGEMRDLETIATALTAAETGHLVFSTLHTTDAPGTIDRVIDVFPPHQQSQIRIQLAAALQGVVCQKVLPLAAGTGRIPATEVLIATAMIRKQILEGATHMAIYEAMFNSPEFLNMHTLNEDLVRLLKEEVITMETAEQASNNVDELKLNLRGIYSGGTKDGTGGVGANRDGGRRGKVEADFAGSAAKKTAAPPTSAPAGAPGGATPDKFTGRYKT